MQRRAGGGAPQHESKEERSTARRRCEIHSNQLARLTAVENYFLNTQFVICWAAGVTTSAFKARGATAAAAVIPSLLYVSADQVVDSLGTALTGDLKQEVPSDTTALGCGGRSGSSLPGQSEQAPARV